ncbi:MAG: hypothetical protein KAW02_03510, partial [candidate division Zixibacteria bacterium]|nr:hypothetical protein [candidate division Zixibacteria bacterium]
MVNIFTKRFLHLVLILVGFIIFGTPSLVHSQKKPIIEKIIVGGNRYFSDGKIKDQMSLKQNKWYNLFKKRRFSLKRAELDQASINSLYNMHGFLEAKCEINAEKKKNSCLVKVKIKEGPQTKLGNIILQGGLPEFEEKAKKEMKSLKRDEPFNWTKLYGVAFNIKTICANNGYPYADVQILVSETEERFISDVTFKVGDDKKVFFGKVAYEGLNLTKQNVASRELTIKEGEVYSREKIMDSQQRVYSTRLFSYITLKAKNVEQKPDKPDFVLRVIEKKPNYVGARVELAQNQPQSV